MNHVYLLLGKRGRLKNKKCFFFVLMCSLSLIFHVIKFPQMFHSATCTHVSLARTVYNGCLLVQEDGTIAALDKIKVLLARRKENVSCSNCTVSSLIHPNSFSTQQ